MIWIPSGPGFSPYSGQDVISVERPQNPKKWTVWTNPDTGEREQWNGYEWIRLTKLDQIISEFGLGTLGDVTISTNNTLTQDSFYDNFNIN